jgi:hypothetical protein
MRGRQRLSTPAPASVTALAPTIQRTVDSSWPVNRPRSPAADDVRERVS